MLQANDLRMISGLTRMFLTCLAFASIALVFSSCAVPKVGPATITKVNPYHNSPGKIVRTSDPMIDFEHRKHMRGAVTTQDYLDRYGNYFTVHWYSEDRAPVTVRLEYRQAKTGLQVHVQEAYEGTPKKNNTTKFQVAGDDYQTNGAVTQWRATVLDANGAEVAEYKSFLWK